MRLVVLGAGQMGEHLLQELIRLPRRLDITLIEKDAHSEHLLSRFDIGFAQGDARIPSVLIQHCADADVLFALTNDDATNLLAALTATDPAIGVERAVVRLSDARHQENPLLQTSARKKAIETILPEERVAEEILGLIRLPGAKSARAFGGGDLLLLRAKPTNEEVFDRPLAGIRSAPRGWILTGILRAADSGRLEIPRGQSRVQAGDEVFAVGPASTAPDFLRAVGLHRAAAQRVVVAGLGQVGRRLSRMLVDSGVEVTTIKRPSNPAVSPASVSILGDATDEHILEEAMVEDADFFVAATDADEVNFMAAHLAKQLGARRTIALHNRHHFNDVMRAVGVDHPISPAVITAGALLRPLHSRATARLEWVEGGGELVEIEVVAGSPATERPLRDLGIPHTSIVGEVVRENVGAFVPDGDTRFLGGDRVAVFMEQGGNGAAPEPLCELEEVFGGARD